MNDAPAPAAARRAGRPGFREQQVIEYVREKGDVRCSHIAVGIGITLGNAYVLVSRMRREGLLVAGSKPCTYAVPPA